MKSKTGAWHAASLLAVAQLWCGLLLGVSFVATPAKFMAPSLSLAVALDVGRQTFAVMNKVEWLFAMALVALAATGKRSLITMAAAAIIIVLLAQTFWLLPLLDSRVALVMEGQQLPASDLHRFYVLLELTKLGALAAMTVSLNRCRIADAESD